MERPSQWASVTCENHLSHTKDSAYIFVLGTTTCHRKVRASVSASFKPFAKCMPDRDRRSRPNARIESQFEKRQNAWAIEDERGPPARVVAWP